MSGVAAEDALLIRAGLIGAACGIALVAGAYVIAAEAVGRLLRRR